MKRILNCRWLLIVAMIATSAFADVTVGITLSATGPAAALGGPQKNTSALLPAELAGQKIKWIVLDDATDPTAATRNAKKLTGEDNVDLLIGATTTANSLAVLNVAAETGTPMISMAPYNPPADKFMWAFQTPQSNTLMAGAVVDHMKANGVKSVGYIGFSDPFGESWFNAFKPLVEAAKIELVANERFNRTDTSVTAQILKIASMNPDAVMIGASGTPAMLPHITLADRGYKGRIYHTHGVANKAVLQLGGAKLEVPSCRWDRGWSPSCSAIRIRARSPRSSTSQRTRRRTAPTAGRPSARICGTRCCCCARRCPKRSSPARRERRNSARRCATRSRNRRTSPQRKACSRTPRLTMSVLTSVPGC